MQGRWKLTAIEHHEWGIGDGWFQGGADQFPNLDQAARESARALLEGLGKYVIFAESSSYYRAEADGVELRVGDRIELSGGWTGTLKLEDYADHSGPIQFETIHEEWLPPLPDEITVEESPLEEIKGTHEFGLEDNAALLQRDDERCFVVAVENESPIVYRIDGDLTWTHGETTPGGVIWRATFEKAENG